MEEQVSIVNNSYNNLLENILKNYQSGKDRVFHAVNSELVKTYWNIGKQIVEFEQDGEVRAKYGENLLKSLANDLSLHAGKGFTYVNLYNMRKFYQLFPKFQTVSEKLSWSHFVEVLNIDDKKEREFYLDKTEENNWSVRELKRQKLTALYLDNLNRLPKQMIQKKPEALSSIIKDTYYLDFLGLTGSKHTESDLENAIIDNIEEFLLELGKGFAFVGRQYRMTIDNQNYYADLVFYHIYLKCYVVIDLKIGKVTHKDIGQMNMYLGYFAIDKNTKTENPPIGIVLAREKDEVMVQYATYGIDSQLFVSKYQLYLPDVSQLRKVVESEIGRK